MIWQFDPAFAGFGVHSGNNWSDLPWDGKILQPRYLMSTSVERTGPVFGRILIRDISSPTNQRTLIAAFVPSWPSGHKTPILSLTNASLDDNLLLLTQLNSLTLDYFLRLRFAISGGGGSLIYATLSELALWKRESLPVEAHQWMAQAALRLTGMQTVLSYAYEQLLVAGQAPLPVAVTPHERLRLRCILDALNAAATGLTADEFRWILRDCDHPVEKSTNRIFTRELFGKGFWRIDKEQHPELRHTVLTLIAFDDLEVKIREHGGNRYAGIAEFIDQNDGEGWLLPETLRLADFGLGHDDRAKHVQTVASTLGPRFYDWQLLSGPFEVLNDFRLHTRHIVDHQGLRRPEIVSAAIKSHKSQNSLAQGQLFDPTKVDATEKVQLP
jgi:hypothetical protein